MKYNSALNIQHQNSDTNERKEISILKYFGWGIWYNIGSLAFSSLIIAFLQFNRYIIEYIWTQTDGNENQNIFIRYILCCCRCFLWFTEKIFKIVNTQCYIEMGLHSTNYITSAYNGANVITENIAKFGVFSVMNTCLSWVVKFTVSTFCTASVIFIQS